MVNSIVEKAATQQADLGGGGTDILGVFGPQNDLQALVRTPWGRIRTVERGARLQGGRIAAIDAEGVIIQKNGQAYRLKLLN
ncbi:hypothetical protein SAMN05444007_101401 [Cribrihabitans marinus]|uniref:Uncharacterized protein n=1 Tax=Cribrihabitans marinus TaxID=1227549 RepID=A0A1H6RC20_9RHOB|nr:hypothetical protein [Cribrihabitans marinus]GGH20471.1 hypothetical protein GCM10010973_04430 [Cribrihabitans marinus]SEI50784.1 hypothetical protein SAMN05444007_101401 [Cribrihabitans marinus]